MKKQLYSAKKSKVKNIGGTPSGSLYKDSKNKGDGSTKKKNETKSFKPKSDYYISLSEIIYRIRKNTPVDLRKPFVFSSDFVKFRKSKSPVVEYHEDVKAKYIACVINKNLEFSKLKTRKFKIGEYDKDKSKEVYYIPLYFIRSLLPDDYDRSDNISVELSDINVFKYTGDIELFQPLNIFSLSTEIYLTNKPEIPDTKIRVLI